MALTSKDIGLDEKFRKTVDLHESEWAKDGKKQPILGRNGLFFCLFFPTVLIVGFIIKASFGWALDTFGFGVGITIAGAFWFFFIWLALEPTLNAVTDLVDFLLQKLFRR